MSLLASIQAKKARLRPSETAVTRLDGKRFLESGNSTQEMQQVQYGFVVDTKPDDVPAEITESLYLGSQDCCDPEILQKYEITNVLSVGIESPVTSDAVTYKFVECLDLPETDLNGCLRECLPFIEGVAQRSERILVHCNAGVSRSSSIVLGYLIVCRGFSYAEAYDVVKKARSCVRPNSGFEMQLKCLFGRNLDLL